MTLAITHSTVVVVPDDGTSPVGTDEWNAAHTLTGTVSVAQGGTGTATALTQGSVVFAGASGVYSQNNASFFWDDANKRLGIGTALPGGALEIAAPVVNTTPLKISGYSLTGSDAHSMIDLSGTFNTSGAPTAFLLNITNTASDAASLLFDFQRAGISQMKSNPNGLVTFRNAIIMNASAGAGRGVALGVLGPVGDISLGNDCMVAWTSSPDPQGTEDVILARDAAGILAQRNSTNAQTFRVYNTYSGSGANYERAIFDWQGTSNVLTIGTEKLGTGSTRNLQFVVGGTKKFDYGVTTASTWTLADKINIPTSQTGALNIGGVASGDGLLQFSFNSNNNDPIQMVNTIGATWYIGDGAGSSNIAPSGPSVFSLACLTAGPTFGVSSTNNRAFLCGSTNAQSLHVYNTYSSSGSNYERAIFDWQTTSNVLTIGTEALGTGTVRGMQLWAGSTSWLDFNVANSGKATCLSTVVVGNHHGTTLATATQLVFVDYINSGSTGPVVLWNVPFQGYVGMGQATTSSSDCRWWIGQATGPNGAWDTSTSSGHTLNLEVFNGSLGLGSAGTVDVYATRSAAGVLTLSQTVGGAANVQLAAASVRGAAVAFASLPTAVEGMLVAVTDSTTVVWGATITGGGGNHVLAYYNGSNWTVAGK